ncbi:MAG: hypothetical protein EXS00_01595 [Phycisphaerales bacterium]|nr:hypothetical protein [Phycisphaerales bacterium]
MALSLQRSILALSVLAVTSIVLLVALGAAQSSTPAKPGAGAPVSAPVKAAEITSAPTNTVSVYVIPMGKRIPINEIDKNAKFEEDCCGQLGTDIHEVIYDKIIEDVKKKKPDLVVYELFSADINQKDYIGDDNRQEMGAFDDDALRRMVKRLREEMGIPVERQVMWVRDSVGFGSLLALSWSNMYMASDARLWGLSRIMERAQVADPQVRAKFREAVVAIANGFLQQAGYSLELGMAMMRPEKKLSATWEGRTIKWLPDASGTWVVDDSDEGVANFTASTAEELGLCDGVADDLGELMWIMGYPDWRQVEGDGSVTVPEYIKTWRKILARAMSIYADYQQHMGWASGNDQLKFLGMAKQDLEKILGYVKQHPAVEVRLGRMGLTQLKLETMIGQLGEQLRGLRKGGSGGGGIGGSGGGGGSKRGPAG